VLITISTDYVFDGEKERGFTLNAISAEPAKAYTQTSKLEGETARAAKRVGPGRSLFAAVTFFGTGGTNFLSTVVEAGAPRRNS